MKKLLQYFLCLIITTAIMLSVIFIYTKFTNGVLFFSAFLIAILSSIIGVLLWVLNNKNFFENFLVLMTFSMFNILFVYFGPVTLDRSLSSFIYIYSAENGKITKNIYDENYFNKYILRRFEDGEKIGYLKCDNNYCYPTIKTKITYFILFPLGKISGTLKNYDEFSAVIDNLP